MPAISPMNLGNDENKDVQWIQLLTGKGVFFFAIVYSRPSDTAGHKSILAHLKKMKARLELMGGVVIMGDLNSRLKHSMTGDSLSTHKQYGELLYSFMMDTGMDYPRNDDLILKDRQWTFYAGNGGRSVVDYLLVPVEEKDIFKSYTTRDDLAIDSQHVIISCTMQVGIPLGDPWGDTNSQKINWDEETKTKFSTSLTKLIEDMDLIDMSLHIVQPT
jgi:hypothetical protein